MYEPENGLNRINYKCNVGYRFIRKGEVTIVSIVGKAFLALIIMPLALTTYFHCIENLKCLQAQEGNDDAFEEHLHLY